MKQDLVTVLYVWSNIIQTRWRPVQALRQIHQYIQTLCHSQWVRHPVFTRVSSILPSDLITCDLQVINGHHCSHCLLSDYTILGKKSLGTNKFVLAFHHFVYIN